MAWDACIHLHLKVTKPVLWLPVLSLIIPIQTVPLRHNIAYILKEILQISFIIKITV